MSKYTTEVRFICENAAGLTESVGYNSINEVLDKSRAKVFDFEFPIFDEAYRPVLENKILKHYYTREICCETVGLWKHFLDTRMNEIMPYYNQLYNSALLEFNPLYDVDLTTDYQKVDNGNNDKTRGMGEQGTFTETDTINETVVLDENKQHSNTNVVNENTRNTNTTVVAENTTNSNTNVVDENIRGTETDTTTQETDGTSGNTTTENRANKNDHWEYFSDTPEGGINGVANLNYLTNATHITDDGAGSTSTSTSSGTTHSETETVANKTNSGERDVTTTDNGSGELDRTTTENGSGELDRTTTDNGTNETDATTTKDSTTEKNGNNSKTINENTSETIKNIEDYLQHVVGKRGAASYSKLLLEYRDTFLNIDLMIIKDLKDLFMNIW